MAIERKDIEARYKWDLSVIYPSETEFYADYTKAEKAIKNFPRYAKVMCNSAKDLYNTLKYMTDLEAIIGNLWQYAQLNFSVESANSTYQSLTAKVRNLAIAAGTASWFVEPYILRIEEETMEKWFEEYKRLGTFRRMIEKIMRRKAHTLSDECEKLMAKMENCLGAPDEVRNIFVNADLRFGKIKDENGELVELTDPNYATFLMSGDRKVRKAAFTGIYKTYEQFGNTFGTLMNAMVKERTTLARVQNFTDSLTASTFRDEVTPEIYNNLIDSVNGGLPVLYDYYALKKEVLGLSELHLYDIYAPLVGELDRKYSYEEAVDEVLKTVSVYGTEYENALRAGLTEKGWVDVYPCPGKRGGAFSSGGPGTEPYILMNYTGTFDNVSTLAHEAGHSMHTWFSTHYNKPHNSSYTIFVAEVASTVNELLLLHRKMNECTSDDEKLYVLNQLMETYKGTLFRQTMFAEFEKTIHALCEKGEPLTSDLLSKEYYDLVCRYFGDGVVCDKQIAYEWMRIPHFYMNFYVYKYATCISAASAIVKRIETEGASYVKKYIDFLKCGGSKSPLESLLVAGIDMTKPEVVTGAIEDFADAIKQFREIYNNKNQ
ncbi:MAG: oligoendopeptidase F [Clostridia bacterium]|nr:oligoendopeptidase F [Clostridia bacterium]